MTQHIRPDFDSRASQWDNLPRRVALAKAVVEAIIVEADPQPGMRMLDYGAGTGLVTLGLLPLVKERLPLTVPEECWNSLKPRPVRQVLPICRPVLLTLMLHGIYQGVDLLVSSMTMHHVPEPAPLMAHFKECMNPGAQLCVADLEQEDGSFHDDATGIPHNGFAIEQMEAYFRQVGFVDIRTVLIMTVKKERDGLFEEYPVNLTIGRLG